ncbi:hypothetical protein EEJ42_22690 [Streptomyces botrytidirepellens]|uniref:Uncharacterized protein n=1 Tax=Streptomyces botrytidirepellens TaxID=2486417 RepID=A0A3M8VZZ3_9ACTN|nr:hypothetical protein EEJ42_22690 [Streptomyces botrytidirepellens]
MSRAVARVLDCPVATQFAAQSIQRGVRLLPVTARLRFDREWWRTIRCAIGEERRTARLISVLVTVGGASGGRATLALL